MRGWYTVSCLSTTETQRQYRAFRQFNLCTSKSDVESSRYLAACPNWSLGQCRASTVHMEQAWLSTVGETLRKSTTKHHLCLAGCNTGNNPLGLDEASPLFKCTTFPRLTLVFLPCFHILVLSASVVWRLFFLIVNVVQLTFAMSRENYNTVKEEIFVGEKISYFSVQNWPKKKKKLE